MDRQNALFFTSLIISGLCLGGSYLLVLQPIIALAVLLPVGGMLLARKLSRSWLANISLIGFAGLGVAGVVLQVPLLSVAASSTAALAAWDLLLEMCATATFEGSLGKGFYESLHLKSLGVAAGLGLLGVGIGQWIRWQAPFIVTILFIILALMSLGWIAKYIQKETG